MHIGANILRRLFEPGTPSTQADPAGALFNFESHSSNINRALTDLTEEGLQEHGSLSDFEGFMSSDCCKAQCLPSHGHWRRITFKFQCKH